jgi:hypothetical protein
MMICAYDDASKVGKFLRGGRVLNRLAFFWRYPENMEVWIKRESENQIIVTKAVNKSIVNPVIKNLKPVFLGKSGTRLFV